MCLKSLKGHIEAVVYGDGMCNNWDLEALTEITRVSRLLYAGC